MKLLQISILIIITLLSAGILNNMMISNKIIKVPSYIYMYVYIGLSLLMITTKPFWVILIINLLLILLYRELIQLAGTNNKTNLFNSGFFIGTMTIINFKFIIFYMLGLFALLYYKNLNWKSIVTQMTGFINPLILFFAFQMILYGDIISPQYNLEFTFANLNVSIIAWLVLILFSIKELYQSFYKKTIYSRKAFIVLNFILAIVFVQILLGNFADFIFLAILPFTIIISNYLIYFKYHRFRTFLLGLLFILFLFDNFII